MESTGFRGIEELPLGKLLKTKYAGGISGKKPKSLTQRLRLRGHNANKKG